MLHGHRAVSTFAIIVAVLLAIFVAYAALLIWEARL
jgi:hypothetical protein